ncbi:hypothetical protein [Denitromonas iodatirespirans]|uniref:Uncharacterized protein n=1 Tax=Denitromonas iodatirespirans TaxID=2795389 RepID=A0A944D6I8_DENI1|nr:hypothetical protein [Denitromonas iodatirespirans]MBT0960915.1 hypothetical protein [Denitromonas iodatirespirans]
MRRTSSLLAGLVLGLTSLMSIAAPATPAQPPAASTSPAPGAPMAKKYVEPCHCSAGEALSPTGAVVFNCECGAMKCVVASATGKIGKDALAPALSCQ